MTYHIIEEIKYCNVCKKETIHTNGYCDISLCLISKHGIPPIELVITDFNDCLANYRYQLVEYTIWLESCI